MPKRYRDGIWKPIGPIADEGTWAWLLPELRLIAEEEREDTIADAIGPVAYRGMVLVILILACTGFALFVASDSLLKYLAFSWYQGDKLSLFVMISLILIGNKRGSHIVTLLFRSRIRRRLREQLVAKDVPVCLHCGYDLSGQTVARCPECGNPFEEALLAHDDGQEKEDGRT